MSDSLPPERDSLNPEPDDAAAGGLLAAAAQSSEAPSTVSTEAADEQRAEPANPDEDDGDADEGEEDVEHSDRAAEQAWSQATDQHFAAGPAYARVGAGPSLSFGFNLEKIPGRGEDSDPILRDGRDLGLVAVFDGMGGAGGTVYDTPEGPRSGAYLASRLARDVVEQRMVSLMDPAWNLNGPATARDLQRSVRAGLQERLAALKAPASGLRSRLLRALPTTMALLALQRREPGGDQWACHAFWAGDSRAYVFRPDTGAQQLTRDDIRDRGDAMANLREDSVINNAMSADTDFIIHHHKVELTAPFLVAAATDGSFGYLSSPMHFEHLVLAALRAANDLDHWSIAVQEAISAVTGDDAAMAVLGVGGNFTDFQQLFAERTTELEQRWIAPLDGATAEVMRRERELAELRHAQQQKQAQLWAAYKRSYEQLLPIAGGRARP